MAEAKQDMLPDSTQGEILEQEKKAAKGSKRKQKSGSKDGEKRKKVSKKKKGSSKGRSKSGSDVDSNLDHGKEKQPLGCYLHDREELINEAFKAVKGVQLSDMIPDILKYVPLDELKQLCLNQLEGMSRKRIKHIIEGTDMLSSSDSDESGPEDGLGEVAVATTSVEVDPAVMAEGNKKQTEGGGAGMETSVDSTVKQLEVAQKPGDREDIDGVPVEIDDNIEHLTLPKRDTQTTSGGKKSGKGSGSKDGGKKKKKIVEEGAKENNARRKRNSEGSADRRSDKVSSSQHRSRSRSSRRRGRRSRSWSSRSRSRDRHSRSRSRSRSWSRSRSRSRGRSWTRSRSWSRSRSRSSWSRSHSRSRSRSPRKSSLPKEPSPPKTPSPPHIEAIQMRYPTPPTPTGSLSSGEIREILELVSDDDKEEEDDTMEGEQTADEEGAEEGDGEKGKNLGHSKGKEEGGIEHQAPGKEVLGQASQCIQVTRASKNEISQSDVLEESRVGIVSSPSNVLNRVFPPGIVSDNVGALGRVDVGDIAERGNKDADNEDDDDDEESKSEDDDESEDDDDDDEEDEDVEEEDIDIDLLDFGVDLDKAKDQPSQLALARASLRPPSGADGQVEKNKQDSGEAQLEVLELELRARAIRSLMHKCLKEDAAP